MACFFVIPYQACAAERCVKHPDLGIDRMSWTDRLVTQHATRDTGGTTRLAGSKQCCHVASSIFTCGNLIGETMFDGFKCFKHLIRQNRFWCRTAANENDVTQMASYFQAPYIHFVSGHNCVESPH